ncbi:hypothetical protein GCM10023114_53950 [Mycolicibacterium sediminis]|uniref:Alcohol dehydrogenase-like N-terminal domain-containing protein n=1 Tax=Mycolicibacterium sediminis TaxID=1286180 RepID=A0A7I7QKP2_9MYCO|nr:hypothetical protein MSEDJ_09470 [Mycolicibacterium sediminis]
MRATLMYGAGDVRVENVADPRIEHPTDALVHITASCICGSDLHPYSSMGAGSGPARMGHEFIGVVEDVGADVTTVAKGDLVVSPFSVSDNTCQFCREGLHTSCADPAATFWDNIPDQGAQAEAIRVPKTPHSCRHCSRCPTSSAPATTPRRWVASAHAPASR